MQKIFLDRYTSFLGKVADKNVYTKWGYSKQPAVSQILKDLGSRDQLYLRFSQISLSALVKDPCAVRDQPEEIKDEFIQSFKRARAYFGIQESTACGQCDQKKTCKFAEMVPTQAPRLEFSDIFNVLTAYADQSLQLEEERSQLDIANLDLDQFLDQFETKSATEKVSQSKSLAAIRNTTQKYKHCFLVLNTLERLVEDNYDKQTMSLIEFCNLVDSQYKKNAPSEKSKSFEDGNQFLAEKFSAGKKIKHVSFSENKSKGNRQARPSYKPSQEMVIQDKRNFNISTELSEVKSSHQLLKSNKFTAKRGEVLSSQPSKLEKWQNPDSKDITKPVQYDDSKKTFARKKPSERLAKSRSQGKDVTKKFHMRQFKEVTSTTGQENKN